MKIGISSTDKDLNAMVDQRFGRCNYFLIVDTDTMNFESISNKRSMASGGAGIQAAQTVLKAGVEVVVTGNMGPNAFQILSTAGIKVFTGANGIVKEAIEKYKKGQLSEAEAATVNNHSGIRR